MASTVGSTAEDTANKAWSTTGPQWSRTHATQEKTWNWARKRGCFKKNLVSRPVSIILQKNRMRFFSPAHRAMTTGGSYRRQCSSKHTQVLAIITLHRRMASHPEASFPPREWWEKDRQFSSRDFHICMKEMSLPTLLSKLCAGTQSKQERVIASYIKKRF